MTADLPSQIGPYRITEMIGRGGSSPVYKAVDPKSGRPVVVRLLSPYLIENSAAAARFERDSRALMSTHHPSLLQILDTGVEGTRPYLVTEWIQGIGLDNVLKERRLSVTEILTVMKGVCRGLAHAHQLGVVHHHISPHAILVAPDLSMAKLTEFGFTRIESLGLTGTVSTGAITLGAFHYLAPEQVDSNATSDHRADIYAVGAVFQEMLTGRPPTGKFSLPSQSNSELLPETDTIVLKCLARNPSERYSTALELLGDLGKLEESLNLRLLSEIRGVTQKAAGSSKGLLIGGLVALLLVLVVVGYLIAR
ncbi:MAG: eukaryotic-like serine/threonine-protein kinase [Acidobacteriota bacterium]|jgi:serine/threonine protein kinase|nr:eukaryotic-like serine/threonine-protein kinase [Acidobacteriota bacterium]